jgi:hypothetical protein
MPQGARRALAESSAVPVLDTPDDVPPDWELVATEET